MPPFPERESSILAKLKKKKGPGAVSVTEMEDGKREGGELNGGGDRGPDATTMAASNAVSSPPPIRKQAHRAEGYHGFLSVPVHPFSVG